MVRCRLAAVVAMLLLTASFAAAHGKEIMVMMDAKTKITQGAKKIDAKTLKIGDRVVASGPAAQG